MDLAGRPEVFRALLLAGALAIGVLLGLLRALRRRAALEEAEEVLRREYEDYEQR